MTSSILQTAVRLLMPLLLLFALFLLLRGHNQPGGGFVGGLVVAASFVRQNPKTEVLSFEHSVVPMDLSWRDSVMTNAERLASIGGGGTCVSAPLALLNARKARGELVVIVSDNESWIDADSARGTATMQEWNAFRSRSPSARLVLIDLQPYATTQAVDREDILNIGGFSDQVFDVVADFAAGRLQSDAWVGKIKAVEI